RPRAGPPSSAMHGATPQSTSMLSSCVPASSPSTGSCHSPHLTLVGCSSSLILRLPSSLCGRGAAVPLGCCSSYARLVLLLASGMSLLCGWVPSQVNPADAPSRLQHECG